MANAQFETSYETRQIIKLFREAKMGDTVCDADISAAIGKPFNSSLSCISTAIRSLRRDDQFRFSRVRNVGYKRLSHKEVVMAADQDLRKVKRVARKGAANLACADYAALNPREQLSATIKQAAFGMAASSVSEDSLKQLERTTSGRLNIKELAANLKAA